MKTLSEALQAYEDRFNEELSQRYTHIMTDDEIIETVKECLDKDMTYFALQQSLHGEDILI